MWGPDDPSAVNVMPTPNPVLTSLVNGGFFAQADLDTGVSPTVLSPDFANGLFVNVQNVVIGAGLTPSKTGMMQLLNAINALILVETTRAEAEETVLTTDYNNLAAGLALAGTDSGVTFTAGTATTYPSLIAAYAKQFGSGHFLYINANTTLTQHNLGLLVVDAGSGSLTITLPPATCLAYESGEARLELIRIDQVVANTVTINCQGSDYFNSTGNSLVSTNLYPGENLNLASNPAATQWFAYRHGASQVAQYGTPANNGLSANNFSPRVGVYQHEISVTGGGGGGGSGPTVASASGAGGGGGATGVGIAGLYPANIYAIIVGLGGAGDLIPASIGGRGATSSFGSLITVMGGYGGAGADTYPNNHGGIGCGGPLDSMAGSAWSYANSITTFENYAGADGNDGGFVLGGAGGIGGASKVGFGGRAFNYTGTVSGGGFGGGGGGAYAATLVGGIGAPGGVGFVLVRERQ
jgi:hypothetical protein